MNHRTPIAARAEVPARVDTLLAPRVFSYAVCGAGGRYSVRTALPGNRHGEVAERLKALPC